MLQRAILIMLAMLGSVPALAMDQDAERPRPVVDGPGVIWSSNRSAQSLLARETAGPDTFALYGGPGEPAEGKFQTEAGPDWGGGNGLPGGYGGGEGAWTPVDRSAVPNYWHVSTFNAENLNGHGPGNQAMWCGVAADDPVAATWDDAPGYGNGWNTRLVYVSAPVANPAVGQTVGLDFWLNHDIEPGFYDILFVEYERAGEWVEATRISGTSATSPGVFPAPGVHYADIAMAPIVYTGGDYGGDFGDQISIRLRFRTDGAWSDEDGLWPTAAGACQVDDITVTSTVATDFEGFEGPGPYRWQRERDSFAGDFADVYLKMSDLDYCRDNRSPMIGFIDYGQIVRNGPGASGATSTGGSTSAGVEYGIGGNFVVNYSGGLSFGEVSLRNEIWSPPIQWDLPGSDDDGIDAVGAKLRFTVWSDLPLLNGIFVSWAVRSARPGLPFGPWRDRDFAYRYSGGPSWKNLDYDVSDLIQPGPESVQIALGCADYAALFQLPGAAGTPSPVYDNVAVYKYRVGGPQLVTRTIDLAQDGFPVNGSIDPATTVSRDALDIPFDMARDINPGDYVIVPGDSVIVDAVSVIPGASLTDLRMFWALDRNPLFEDAIRSAPDRPKDQNVVAGPGTWTGEVLADSSFTRFGARVPDRFFVDLPDEDFLYPGDVLHYYLQATDSDGRVTTLPAVTDGFADFGPTTPFERAFIVRGLPSLTDAAGAQPKILVINDFGRRGVENEFVSSLQALGFLEGAGFDSYTVQGPTSLVSNGIGSRGGHGAEPGQLLGYEHILYFTGDLAAGLLSNGDATLAGNDKGFDIEVLEQWQSFPSRRNIAFFGDFIATGLAADSPDGLGYLTGTMGVDVLGPDVRAAIGGQVAPTVVPSGAGTYGVGFSTQYVAFGGCPELRQFDQIQPLLGAEPVHFFTDGAGIPITGGDAGVASVVNPTTWGKVMTFPYSFMRIRGILGRSAVASPARTLLLQEIFGMFNVGVGPSPPVAAPERRDVELRIAPNPFNPKTTIEFTAAPGSTGSVRVYTLKGELVRVLHHGEFLVQRFEWDGRDDRGVSVSSGVYLIRAEDGTARRTAKVALVK